MSYYFLYGTGCRFAAIPKAAAINAKFLIIYWPSSVGVKNPDHVSPFSKNSGIKVVIICIRSSGITTLSAPFIKNNTPINISSNPNKIINAEKDIQGIVVSKSLCTTPLAGERPITLRTPNQKNITNNPKRATGTDIFLKKCITSISVFLKFILRLSFNLKLNYL